MRTGWKELIILNHTCPSKLTLNASKPEQITPVYSFLFILPLTFLFVFSFCSFLFSIKINDTKLLPLFLYLIVFLLVFSPPHAVTCLCPFMFGKSIFSAVTLDLLVCSYCLRICELYI